MQPKAPWYVAKHGSAPKPKLRKRINPASARARERHAQYSTARRKFLKDHPVCQVKFDGCSKVATEVHHKNGRRGKRLTDESGFVASCRACHAHIHNHPDQARKRGVLGSFL